MRFFAAIFGVIVSIPPLIFFWIGTQTFIRPGEKALAMGVTALSALLLLLSLTLFFASSLQRFQVPLLITTVAVVAIILATVHR